MTSPLSTWLSLEVFRVLLVFVRVGTAFQLLPGFGEVAVPVRIRVLAGLAVAIAVAPAIAGMPDAVPPAWGLLVAIAAEATAGVLIGVVSRTVVSGLLIAGQMIGQNVGLMNVFAVGMAPDQAAAVGATVYAGLIAALFAADGHHAVLRAIVDSYGMLSPGQFPNIDAGALTVMQAGARSFRLATQLALPFLLVAMLFNVSLAAINRALPSIPVFQIASPAITAAGLYLLAAAAPGMIDQGLLAWSDMLPLLR
jgi:flagellar biosynthetic protein FliR